MLTPGLPRGERTAEVLLLEELSTDMLTLNYSNHQHPIGRRLMPAHLVVIVKPRQVNRGKVERHKIF